MGTPWQVRARLCAVALVSVAVLVGLDGTTSRAGAQETGTPCVDPSGLARSVVSLAWYFDKPRPGSRPGREVVGERATAWFYTSPRLLVTAAHFANDLPPEGWQDVELRQDGREGGPAMTVRTRLRVVVRGKGAEGPPGRAGPDGGLKEDVAILELQEPFPGARGLDIEPEMPAKGASVLILGYPGGHMQAAHGIVRTAEDSTDKYAGLEFLEVQGSNRLLLNAGASGAPVLDCRQGRVVAVLNGLLTGPSVPFLAPEHPVIPTSWGSPTNTAVPASRLTALRNRVL